MCQNKINFNYGALFTADLDEIYTSHTKILLHFPGPRRMTRAATGTTAGDHLFTEAGGALNGCRTEGNGNLCWQEQKCEIH